MPNIKNNPNTELVVYNIKQLSKQQSISMRELAKRIGMTTTGFHRTLENGSIKVNTLFEIANALKVHPFQFYFTPVVRKNKIRNQLEDEL